MPPEIVFVTGSRNPPRLLETACVEVVGALPEGTTLVHGGAEGIDALAASVAADRGFPVEVYEPDYARYGRHAPLQRNTTMAKRAHRGLAFWDGQSTGTVHAVRELRRYGKRCDVYQLAVRTPQDQALLDAAQRVVDIALGGFGDPLLTGMREAGSPRATPAEWMNALRCLKGLIAQQAPPPVLPGPRGVPRGTVPVQRVPR